MLDLVNRAAVYRDVDATAALVSVLRPADLSLLRLLAFRRDRRANAATLGPPVKAAAAATGSGSAAAPLSGLQRAAEQELVAFAARKKTEERAARLAALKGGEGGSTAAASLAVDKADAARPGDDLRALVRTLSKQRIVRSWVWATVRAGAPRGTGALAAARNGGAALRASAVNMHAKLISGTKWAHSGAADVNQRAATETALDGAAAGGGRAGGPGPKRGRISSLKKRILRDRIEAWVRSAPAPVASLFARERRAFLGESAAVAAAEADARATARAAAEKGLRKAETKRILRRINAGKIILPTSRTLGPSGRSVFQMVNANLHARELAERVKLPERRIQRETAALIKAGTVVDPLVAGAEARAAWKREAGERGVGSLDVVAKAASLEESSSAGVENGSGGAALVAGGAAGVSVEPGSSSGVADGEAGALPDAAMALALRLARTTVTLSTVARDIKAVVPKAGARNGIGAVGSPPSDGVASGDAVGGACGNDTVGALRCADGGTIGAGAAEEAAVRFSSDMDPLPALDEILREMIATASFYQERARNEATSEAAKASVKKRLVVGLRQVTGAARLGRLKLLVVAPNADVADGGALDAALCTLVDAARAQTPPAPVFFALSRRRLGAALGSSVRATAVGFLSLENLRDQMASALVLAEQARAAKMARLLSAAPVVRAPVRPLRAEAEEWIPGGALVAEGVDVDNEAAGGASLSNAEGGDCLSERT